MSDKASLKRLLYEHAKAERTEEALRIEDQIVNLFDAVRDELHAAWQQEHDERVRLDERVKFLRATIMNQIEDQDDENR